MNRTTSDSSVPSSYSGVGEKYFGELSADRCVLLVCDLQERFGPSVVHFDAVVENVSRLVKAARIMGVPVVATEQYPKVRGAVRGRSSPWHYRFFCQGLGKTVHHVRSQLGEDAFVSKTKFTMLVPEVEARLDSLAGEEQMRIPVAGLLSVSSLRRTASVHFDACSSLVRVFLLRS